MYQEFIQNIINTRGQWNIPVNEYFEGHHIIPVCLGGTGDPRKADENIIWLYPEEHYEAHKLLALENPQNLSLVIAWDMMAFPKSNSTQRNYTISAEDYAAIKKLLSQVRGKKIICIETQEIFNSIQEAGRKYGEQGNIGSAVQGKRTKACGYHWAYLNDINKQNELKEFIGKSAKLKEKPIICIETQKVFKKITDAAKYYSIQRSNISSCLLNKVEHAGGYHWVYLNDEVKQKELSCFVGKLPQSKLDLAISLGHKVLCIETNEVFYSAKEAAKTMNKKFNYKLTSGHIMRACRGLKKTTAGYHWKFLEKGN